MRSRVLVASAVLVFGLSACGGNAATSRSSPEPTATASSQQGATENGQTSADAAAQAYLRAIGTGDASAACAVMESDGEVIGTDPAKVDLCQVGVRETMDLVSANREVGELSKATVTGASVSGDKATFEKATVTPDLGTSLLKDQSAVQINGKWYLSFDEALIAY